MSSLLGEQKPTLYSDIKESAQPLRYSTLICILAQEISHAWIYSWTKNTGIKAISCGFCFLFFLLLQQDCLDGCAHIKHKHGGGFSGLFSRLGHILQYLCSFQICLPKFQVPKRLCYILPSSYLWSTCCFLWQVWGLRFGGLGLQQRLAI